MSNEKLLSRWWWVRKVLIALQLGFLSKLVLLLDRRVFARARERNLSRLSRIKQKFRLRDFRKEPRIASMPSCDLFPLRNSVVVAEFVLILFNNRTRWRFLAFYLQFASFFFTNIEFYFTQTFVSPSTTRVIHARRLTLFATAGVMFDKITTRSGSNEELLIKFLAPDEAHCEAKWHSAAL